MVEPSSGSGDKAALLSPAAKKFEWWTSSKGVTWQKYPGGRWKVWTEADIDKLATAISGLNIDPHESDT